MVGVGLAEVPGVWAVSARVQVTVLAREVFHKARAARTELVVWWPPWAKSSRVWSKLREPGMPLPGVGMRTSWTWVWALRGDDARNSGFSKLCRNERRTVRLL